jgi:SAM-dependent methyltransferase
LDVGGSAGIVAREVVREFGLKGTVLDPATEEVAAAREAGLEGIVGSVETWNTNQKFDLILLCRSIEHMFDLRLALSRIRSQLTPQGLFYCDTADFMEMCRLMGPPETFTKVDHCYWLSQSTALGIFHMAGFELVSMNIVTGYGEVGFLLRACEPASAAHSSSHSQVLAQIEEIQAIVRDWRAFGNSSQGSLDWLRWKAYRAKRRLIHALRPPKRARTVSPDDRVPTVIAHDAVKGS